MSGIVVEKTANCGQNIWLVKDTQTNMVLSYGDTVVDAVSNYEQMEENKEMAKKIGLDLDNLNF